MALLRYTRDHEWIRIDVDEGTVGITDFAQKQLGDVVYVELPAIGSKAAKGTPVAVVESVKAASEVYAPVAGEVIAVNATLADDPARVNSAAEGDGWFFKIRIADPDELRELMDKSAYATYIAGL
jgi:glycine cleavage system H protein